MQDGAGRVAGGLVLLVALWIGVYWWWPAEPKITFAADPSASPEKSAPAPAPLAPPKAASKAAEPKPKSTTPPAPREPVKEPVKSPPAPIAVVPPQFIEHTIAKGDTYESLSRKYYKTAAHAAAISRANPYVGPNRLIEGRVILIPRDPTNVQGVPVAEVTPILPEEYVVEDGDTLSKIAQEIYGDSRLSTHIFEANRDRLKSEHSLKIGDRLRIPPRPKPPPPR